MSTMKASALSEAQIRSSDILECRLCLLKKLTASKTRDLLGPWSTPWIGMEATVAEDLMKLTNIQVTESDVTSKIICFVCYEKLKNACNFVYFVKSKDLILKQRNPQIKPDISSESVWPRPIQVDKNIAGGYENDLDMKIKQELLSGDEEMMETKECQNDFINLDIKVEPEEIVAPDHPAVNGFDARSIPLSNYNQMNGDANTEYCSEEYLESSVKEEPMSDEDTASRPLDLPLDCLLCSKNFHSVSGLKAHVIAQHSYKSVKRRTKNTASPAKRERNEYICATCRRTFTTSTDLMVHETCHSKMVCYICNQKFDTFDQLSKHRKRCKANKSGPTKPKTLDDVKRPVTEEQTETKPALLTCPLCPEQFSEKYYLKIHQEIHHSLTENDAPSEDKNDVTQVSLQSLNDTLQDSNEDGNGLGIISSVSSTLNVNVEVEKVNDIDDMIDVKSNSVSDTVSSVEASLESIFGIVDSETKTEVDS